MTSPRLLSGLLLPLLFAAVAAEAAPLTLRQLEHLALEKNPALRGAVYSLRASAATVRQGYGIYDPRLSANLSLRESREPMSSGATSETRALVLGAGIVKQVDNGGSLRLGVDLASSDNLAATTVGIDPAWSNQFSLSYTQPLWNGYGQTVTEEAILIAARTRDAAFDALRQQAAATLVQVRNLYGRIQQANELIGYREASLVLANRILDENRARVAAGLLPPIDVLEAEVGVKQRERDLLDARQAAAELVDQLAALVDLDTLEVAGEPLPGLDALPTEEAAVAEALAKRPELARQRQNLERLAVSEEVARNRTRARLDLSASYAQKGLDSTPGGGIGDALGPENRNWQVGLNYAFPLGNRAAESNLAIQRHQLGAARSELQRLQIEVRREVRSALRQLDIGKSRLAVSAKGRELAEEKLRTLLKRREVGLATTRDVLEGETDLQRARSDQSSAQTDYLVAVTDLLRASGRLLDHEGVTFLAADADSEQPYVRLGHP